MDDGFHRGDDREGGPGPSWYHQVNGGRQPIREGAVVVDGEGSAIGKVTSGGFSPSLQQPIAMAYVPAEQSELGSKITIEQRGKTFTGTVTAMPFIPNNYHRQPKR